MRLHYHIYPELKIMVVRAEGVVTQPERVETMLAWLADPGYQACIGALCDFSEAESTPERHELLELVTMLDKHHPTSGPKRIAIVASKIITFGVARLFEDMVHFSTPLQVKVFEDRGRAW